MWFLTLNKYDYCVLNCETSANETALLSFLSDFNMAFIAQSDRYTQRRIYETVKHLWRKFFANNYVIRRTIWYHLYSFKNVKNTYAGVLLY